MILYENDTLSLEVGPSELFRDSKVRITVDADFESCCTELSAQQCRELAAALIKAAETLEKTA